MARILVPIAAAAAFVAAAAASVAPGLAGDEVPKSPAQALERARPLLDNAAALPPFVDREAKVFLDMAAGLRSALALLKGQEKAGAEDPAFLAAWNETVSLGHYHGMRNLPEYRLEVEGVRGCPLRLGLPAGRGWTYRDAPAEKTEVQVGLVARKLPDGRLVRSITFSHFAWNTLHDGIGGENARGLAEAALRRDRSGMQKITFRSDRVATVRMGRGFPKANGYEIVGEHKDLGPVRYRGFYVKGASTTYAFEVAEFRKVAEGDSPWVRWQIEGNDPELDAVLESLDDAAGRKK
jgi:hypothetical protein